MKAYHEKRTYPKNLPIKIYKHIQSSFSFHAHWHSDIELIYVCEGTLRFGINRDIKTLSKGDVAICCSGDIHFYDSQNMESTIYILVFKPSLIGCPGNWPEDIRFKNTFYKAFKRIYGISPKNYCSDESIHPSDIKYIDRL